MAGKSVISGEIVIRKVGGQGPVWLSTGTQPNAVTAGF